MESVIQTEKECFVCLRTTDLESHHCIHGTSNRKNAEKYGLKIWLCHQCHSNLHDRNHELDLAIQQMAQRSFEQEHTRSEWMQIFGKNYLD